MTVKRLGGGTLLSAVTWSQLKEEGAPTTLLFNYLPTFPLPTTYNQLTYQFGQAGCAWGFGVEVREPFKYYFADFVRKGGEGGTPQIRNFFFAKKISVNGGGGYHPNP